MEHAPRAGDRAPLRGRDRRHRAQATESRVLSYFALVAGFVYLLMAADLLVRGAVALAHRARVSPVLVAATVVALGTSLPELVVALRATLTGHPEMVLGNVIGSNTANILLVVGAAAVVSPLSLDRAGLRRDSLSMLAVSLVFVLMCVTIGLGRLAGILLLSGFFLVWGSAARAARRENALSDADLPMEWVLGLPQKLPMVGLFIALGAIGLPLGARLVVDAAVTIAAELGITEAVVGLTIIAFSTSLPELATTVVAAFQRRSDVAAAGILGSNILNLVGILGLSALISASPITVPASMLRLDLPVMIGVTLMLTLLVWFRRSVGRVSGAIWVTAYVAYIGLLFAMG